MTTTNAALIESVYKALVEDETAAGVRWDSRELVQYLNDGLLLFAQARPDLFSTEAASHALVAGVRQTLPTGGFKLFEVLANAAGTAVTPIDQKILNACVPGWRGVTQAANILHFMFDPRQPAYWECYPPATNGTTARLRYAAYAAPVSLPSASALPSAVSGDVPAPDVVINPLREYILYRAKSKDADYAPGVLAASQTHLANCERQLGAELAATAATAPRKALES